MKILLDENLPVKLKYRFSSTFSVFTVNDMKWNSLKNGELLKALTTNNFDVLVTSDKSIPYQHNLSGLAFRFVIINIPNNRYETLLPLVPVIESELLNTNIQIVQVGYRE